MGRVLGFLLLIALCVVAYGAGRGWFSASSTEGDHSSSYELRVRNDRIRRDRDEFLDRAQARLQELDLRLRELQTRADHESGQAKQDLDTAIAQQRRDLDAAQRRMDDWRATTAEKWDDAKLRASQALDDLKQGFDKAFSRFQ